MAQLNVIVTQPEFWLALAAVASALALIAWRTRLTWRPAWLLRTTLTALVLAGIFFPRDELEQAPIPEPHVMIVDQSDSLEDEMRSQAWMQALDWQAAGENRMVVAAGAEPRAVLGKSSAGRGYLLPQVDGRASDLAGALRLAQTLMDGRSGSVTLASDGLVEQPEQVRSAAETLAENGIALDILSLAGRSPAGDLALGRLSAPANLWAGSEFDLFATVIGEDSVAPAKLTLKVDGRNTDLAAEQVSPGVYRFHLRDVPEGIVTLEVSLAAETRVPGGSAASNNESAQASPDPFPENNHAYATLQVFPPPKALFVSADPGRPAAASFLQALNANGVQTTTALPEQLPTNLNQIQGYQVIFLDNLLASQLGQEQMRALQLFVSRLAGGLVTLGGRNSYTLGGYSGTPLEAMLPIQLEPPTRSKRPPMVFQLILDRSSSMEISSLARDEPPPIALAREAAMRSIETLREEDYLGVLTFSDAPNWDVALEKIRGAAGLRQALDAVSQVEPNGGTQMFKAMQTALEAMAELPADAPVNRHILMLSDGQSTDGNPADFRTLAEQVKTQGVTISTIALGTDADTDLMETIAETAEGRFYAVRDPNDLPRILISESEAARSENVQIGETRLKIGESGHPILSGLSQRQLPVLNGYNALRSKAEAGAEDVLLASGSDDSLLATWQYGLGRVTAWMGDLGDEWSGPWADENTAGQFWSQVIRYGLVDPSLGPAQVSIDVAPTRLNVEALLFQRDGQPLNLAQATFSYSETLPDGSTGEVSSYRLIQSGVGAYQLSLPRPVEGAYRAVLEFEDENEQKVEIPAPFVVDPPAEWLPRDPEPGRANLQAWAQAGGGRITSFDELQAPAASKKLENAPGWEDPWQRLMAALAMLWVLEIAIRRRWLPWS